MDQVYASDEARKYAIDTACIRAAEDAGLRLPQLRQAHEAVPCHASVLAGPPPLLFCRKHLPRKDAVWIVLVDEEGAEFPTMYLPCKTGISANWRQFAMDHGLVVGDCLVFELIEPTKFRVHIIRQSSYHPEN